MRRKAIPRLWMVLIGWLVTVVLHPIYGQLVLAQARPETSFNVVYYSIMGSTAQELRSQMNQLGPTSPTSGRRFDAYTKWNVRWNYQYANRGDLCQIATANVTTTIMMTLPKWQPSGKPARALGNRWNAYMKALRLHEDGHKNHGMAAGQEILTALKTLPPQSSCSQLGNRANTVAQQIIQTYNQRDVDYDRQTQHGATQGARFP